MLILKNGVTSKKKGVLNPHVFFSGQNYVSPHTTEEKKLGKMFLFTVKQRKSSTK